MQKIIRLSRANLRRHKGESLLLVLLIAFAMCMLGSVLSSHSEIRDLFPNALREIRGAENLMMMDAKYFDPAYLQFLSEEESVTEYGYAELVQSLYARCLDPEGREQPIAQLFINQENEQKIEQSPLISALSESEIAALEHPVWIPYGLKDNFSLKEGDSYTVLLSGRAYPFQVAGFYESGVYTDSLAGFKLIVSDADYRVMEQLADPAVIVWFNTADPAHTDTGVISSRFISKCEDYSQQDLTLAVYSMLYLQRVSDAAMEVKLLLILLSVMSVLVMLTVLFIIRYRISNDIDEQMVSIGVLEALGYRFADISAIFTLEYLLIAAAGILLGTAAALPMLPGLYRLGELMSGHHGTMHWHFGSLLIAAALLTGFVLLISCLRARSVHRYPPVQALRRGIRDHHYRKNPFPLTKTRKSVTLRLAMNGFMQDLRRNIGVGLCIMLASLTLVFCLILTVYTLHEVDFLRAVAGFEISDVLLGVTPQTDLDAFAAELLEDPDVRKVVQRGEDHRQFRWKARDAAFMPQVYDDFSQLECVKAVSGRFPQHENEIMLTNFDRQQYQLRLGDTLNLSFGELEKPYIITGFAAGISRSTVILTGDGFRRIDPAYRHNGLHVYLREGADREAYIQKLTQRYGKSALDVLKDSGSGAESFAERIRLAAQQKISAMMQNYGVNHVDYAVTVGDTVISGDSSYFRLLFADSTVDLIQSADATLLLALRAVTMLFLIAAAMIVIATVYVLTEAAVRKQWMHFGIMKSMGYTTKMLMKQIFLRIIPTVLAAAVLGDLLSMVCIGMLGDYIGTVLISVPLIAAANLLELLLAAGSAYWSARKIRSVSARQLMTE